MNPMIWCLIDSHQELRVYQTALASAMRIFQVSQAFPEMEQTLLTHQVVRSSRLVCVNLAEAWQKRRYKGAFVAKLNQVEAEVVETLTWLELAVLCGYLEAEVGQELFQQYGEVLAGATRLIKTSDAWVVEGV